MYQHRNIFNLSLTVISTEDQILLDKYLVYNSCNVLSVTNINITSIISIETLLHQDSLPTLAAAARVDTEVSTRKEHRAATGSPSTTVLRLLLGNNL